MARFVARWLRAAVVVAAVTAFSTACARSSPDTEPIPDGESRPDAMLRVENRGFSDMTIYLLRGSQRIRLGVVNGNTTSSFTIRSQYLTSGPLSFLADPIGSSRTPVSDELVVNPGDIVTLMIPAN